MNCKCFSHREKENTDKVLYQGDPGQPDYYVKIEDHYTLQEILKKIRYETSKNFLTERGYINE